MTSEPRPTAPASSRPSLEDATLHELEAASRASSAYGVAALGLARRIDSFGAVEGGSALAGLVKEHAAALARALGGVTVDTLDPFDELARRREERRNAAGG